MAKVAAGEPEELPDVLEASVTLVALKVPVSKVMKEVGAPPELPAV